MFFNARNKSQNTKPATRNSVTVRDFTDTQSMPDEVLDVKSVPDGEYAALPAARFTSQFLLLKLRARSSDGRDQYVLLVAFEAWMAHQHWELFERLKQAGQNVEKFYRTKAEVIKGVHSQHLAVLSRDGTAKTEIQEIAFALVDKAVDKGASDIHIETRGAHAAVFFRIYGERVWQEELSMETATAVCNTLYTVHADANSKEVSWDPNTVKEAVIEHVTKGTGKKVQLRFESTPIHPASEKNFQAVIRLLVMESASKPISKVGYEINQQEVIDEMLLGAQGMVILVGPTNSGKSTSMQAFMQRIFEMRGKHIKAVTVEDPVEYIIPGACQMGIPKGRKNLESQSGSTFQTFLKATLRLDPDVVLVGEIRDAESAANTKDLVLAGRKLLTTLHAFDSFAVFERLKQMGVPPDVLYMPGFIAGIIYQRLVPTICAHCGVALKDAVQSGVVKGALLERIERVSDYEQHQVRIRSRGGCAKCDHKGIGGRTPCAEIIKPDETLLLYLRRGDERAAREYWRRQQRLRIADIGVTAVSHAIDKMRRGLLDPRDIESQLKTLGLAEDGNPDGAGTVGRDDSFGFRGNRFDGPQLADSPVGESH